MIHFKKFYKGFFNAVLISLTVLAAAFAAAAQSSDQNFPTPVTSNVLNGTIPARDIGDSRLTTYYFTFGGNQGDVFINIVTNNLNGDIDVFAADGLRPLTKVVVYADSTQNETGRVIYLRKPEKILMRIQGRTPNDDPATFQIKFAGSFVAGSETDAPEAPKLPEVRRENESGVVVNSVGTIIAVKPKPTPEPKAETAVAGKTDRTKPVREEKKSKPAREKTVERSAAEKREKVTAPEKREAPRVVVTQEPEPAEEMAVSEEEKKDEAEETTPENEIPQVQPAEVSERTDADRPETETVEKKSSREDRERARKEKEAAALENIRLVVILKDGGKIERPMSEVLRFGVERGVLTIIHKNGSISRFSILEVESVTIR
jgi:hypothetical protein